METSSSLNWKFFRAAYHGDCEKIKKLHATGRVNVHTVYDQNTVALQMAVRKNHLQCVDLLCSLGCDVNFHSNFFVAWSDNGTYTYHNTALYHAISNQNYDMAKRLLHHGAHVDEGLLVYTIYNHSVCFVRMLVEAGATIPPLESKYGQMIKLYCSDKPKLFDYLYNPGIATKGAARYV